MSDEATAPGTDVPAVVKPRVRQARRPSAAKKRKPPERWSTARANIFLAALADTSNIAGSARKAKLSESTVRRRRLSDPDFAARWAVALREGYLKLEADMLARALAGVTREQWYGGKKVGEVREHDDRQNLSLLTRHRAAVTGDDPVAPVPVEEARARFRERLAEMNRRMGGAG